VCKFQLTGDLIEDDKDDTRTGKPKETKIQTLKLRSPDNPPWMPSCWPNVARFTKQRGQPSESIQSLSLSSAECCLSALSSYVDLDYHDYLSQKQLWQTIFTTSSTEVSSFVAATCSGPVTTLTDDIPRALCSPNVKLTILKTTIITYRETSTTAATSETTQYAVPRPTCKVDFDDWKGLWEKNFRQDEKVWNDWKGDIVDWWTADSPSTVPYPALPADIGAGEWCPGTNAECSCFRSCLFEPEDVKMLYWPMSGNETPSSLGKGSKSEIVTAMLGSITLTSPTIYAFFTTLQRKPPFGFATEDRCGGIHTSVAVPLESDNIVSWVPAKGPVTNWLEDYSPELFTWEHLEVSTVGGNTTIPLVPYSAYLAQPKCQYVNCATIFNDYFPSVAFKIPSTILSSIDPAWGGCATQFFRFSDPPIALQPNSHIALPTVFNFGTEITTTAAPAVSALEGSSQTTASPKSSVSRTPSPTGDRKSAAISEKRYGRCIVGLVWAAYCVRYFWTLL
jgi:hypothetical protein